MKRYFCLPLLLLVTTSALDSNQVTQPQSPAETFATEAANIVKDFTSFINDDESSPTSQVLYTAEKYGSFAAALNKFKQMMESSKQEAKATAQAIKEVGNVFTDDVFFDFLQIVDKKKKLEKLSVFIDESEKRAEKAQSDYKTWISTSTDIDEISRKFLLETHYKNAEKNEFFRKETHKAKKKLTQELIKLLDFLSRIYGTYEKGENPRIVCTNDQDVSILNAHFGTIAKLVKEEEKLSLQYKQYLMELSKPLSATSDPSPEKMQQQTANTVKELENIFKGFVNNEPSRTLPTSPHTTEEYGPSAALLDRFQQFMKLCRQEAVLLEQAANGADLESICTEEVFFDLAKITKSKKRLEDLCTTIDESVKRLEKYRSDLLQWILSIPYLDDEHRKKLTEDFTKTEPVLGKQSFAIRKEIAIEYINLLNFLSMRYGTYKLINNKAELVFSSEIENKLYESYIKKINKLFKEGDEVELLIEQRKREVTK